ncbi:hypothetical protein ACGF4C_18480 [Streptomyces sp. NPDC048197]|uniref:hypothetical protein n=1 Tax=Streptomyces sp. NPDC048197 TaxID=3365511 RepID=UPI0037175063
MRRTPRDRPACFAAATGDPPLGEGVALALSSAEDGEVGYLTGRPERCRRDTLDWLARHAKLETLHRIARHREIRHVVDDDEQVCDAFEAAGCTVVRARWATPSSTLRDAQRRAGRT